MTDVKPIHPEIVYAERSSATEPEKVRLSLSAPRYRSWVQRRPVVSNGNQVVVDFV